MTERKTRGRRRKDRILNTRITDELDEQLRQAAEEMDVSVSQLVRRILQRTVDMVGNLSGNVEYLLNEVVEDVANIADASKPGPAARDLRNSPLLRDVIGWQPVKAQRRQRCALTGAQIEAGDDAWVSVRADAGEPILIGRAAFEAITRPRAEQWVELVVSSETTCADSGKSIAPGDKAWMRAGSKPPEIICQAAYLKRKSETA